MRDLKRRRGKAEDLLSGARARKGQRVVWSDSSEEEESGAQRGHAGEGGRGSTCSEGQLRARDVSGGSAGGKSVAVVAEAAERVTGLDGDQSCS